MRASDLLCYGVVLAALACSHDSSATRHALPEPWTEEDAGIRLEGCDSASSRLPVLIARGQLYEAEELLKQLVTAGLMARETARQWQEHLDQAKEHQRQAPRLPPLPIHSEDLEPGTPSSERRTCWTELPNLPVCRALPEEYSFHSHRQALEAMKQRLGAKSLTLHNPSRTESGPCRTDGQHFNVRQDGRRVGSIVCCPCCVENEPAPLAWTRCRIVW